MALALMTLKVTRFGAAHFNSLSYKVDQLLNQQPTLIHNVNRAHVLIGD